ncbi:MAG: PKD domain-containing protein [Thermoplasmata archaeon]
MALLVLGSILIMVSPQTRAELNPPVQVGPDTWVVAAGDWVIENGDNIVHGNKTIYVEAGNVVIENGGALTLYNVTLQLNSTFSGEFHIEVQDGGTFRVLDGGDGYTPFDMADTDQSTLLGSPFEFQFWVRGSAVFEMNNSVIAFMGETHPPGPPLPTLEPYGLYVESDNVVIRRSGVIFSGGIIANGSSPRIYDSVFVMGWFGVASFNAGNPYASNLSANSLEYAGVLVDASSIEIYDSRIDSTGVGAFLMPGVQLVNGSYALVSNVSVSNNGNGGLVVENSHIDLFDSRVTNNGPWGLIMLEDQYNLFTSVVRNNTFSQHPNTEIVLDAFGDSDVVIEHNNITADPGATGIWLSTDNNLTASLGWNNITSGDQGIVAMAQENATLNLTGNWFEGLATQGVQTINFGDWQDLVVFNNTFFNLGGFGGSHLNPVGELSADVQSNSIILTGDAGIILGAETLVTANIADNYVMATGMTPSMAPAGLITSSNGDASVGFHDNQFFATSDTAIMALATRDLDINLSSNACLWCSSGPTFSATSFVATSGGNMSANVYNNSIDLTGAGNGMNFTASGQWATLDFVENTITNSPDSGIYVDLLSQSDILFDSNDVSYNGGAGVYVTVSNYANVVARDNQFSRNAVYGLGIVGGGPLPVNLTLEDNYFVADDVIGLWLTDINISSRGNYVIACNNFGAALFQVAGTMEDEEYSFNSNGIIFDAGSQVDLINSTLDNAGVDIFIDGDSHITTLNTTFDRLFGLFFGDMLSSITVNWFLHVRVETQQAVPLVGATVDVEDFYQTPVASRTTGADGMVRWMVVTEFHLEGFIWTYYTPHNITATLAGFGSGVAQPNMDATKTVVIQLADVEPPMAVANDVTVDEDTLFNLDSTGSGDNVAIVNWTWVVSDIGGDVYLYGPNPFYMFSEPGSYGVNLTVTDAAGLSGWDTATITVNDITDPIADAGPDQAVFSGDQVFFDGTNSTDNVGVVNYTWTFTYDGGPINLWGAAPNFTFVTPGIYDVTLTARDAAGNTGSDAVTITVEDNEAPVADAGPDQLNNDEGTTIYFDGTASTDNVGIVTFKWEFDYGPNHIVLEGATQSFVFEAIGEYTVTLKVTDGVGLSDTDTMVVSIVDSTPPEVVSTSPPNGVTDVSIATDCVIVFSEAMDTDSTEMAISIEGATIKSFDWSNGDSVLTLDLSGLEEDKEYTVIIADNATDVEGNEINDYVLTFRTQPPPALFSMENDWWWIIIVIILIVVIAILALRKPKAPAPTPQVYEPVAYEPSPPAEYPLDEPDEAPPEEPPDMPEEAPEEVPEPPEGPPEEEAPEPPEEPEE